MTETLTGAQITVRLLERQGVRLLTGYPGGAILPIYDALGESTTIRHVLPRHEQGAGFIAQGMARVSGEVAVCLASSGPSATNLLTAIADAKLDSIPLVAITGQVPRAMIGTDAFQEVDVYGLSLPITKHNFLVSSTEELLEVIPRAFAIAASGRPGPVLIDIPKDVQSRAIEIADWPEPGCRRPVAPADGMALTEAAALISAARQPILYLGGGVIHAGASRLATELAEKANLPTVMTLMALGAMPVDHRLSLGMLGMHGAPCANLALEECDLLIAVGARFDDRATGKVAAFCPQAKIVHIDIDAAELGKIKAAHVGIVADLGEALARLLPMVPENPRSAWNEHIDALKTAHPQPLPGLADPRSHFGLIRCVAACVDDEAIVVTDVGQHQMWVAQAYPLRRPRQWLTSGGLGTMGFGVPTAIGAALGRPRADGDLLHRRRIDPDEHPGTGDCRGGAGQPQDRAPGQRRTRPGAPAADAVLRPGTGRLDLPGAAGLHRRRPRLRHRRGRSRRRRQPAGGARRGLRPPRPVPDPRPHRRAAEGLSHGAARRRQP